MIYNAIIIDDEVAGRNYLTDLITEFVPQVKVVGTANSAIEGFKLLNNHKVDIIFLDIEMPSASGFDFLEGLESSDYKVVFTTAHQDYALKAFKVNADGYLLKPVDLDDLEQLISLFQAKETKADKDLDLVLKTVEEIIYISQKDIVRIEGEGNYTTVYSADGNKTTVSKGLKLIESFLTSSDLIRVHQSHIINRNFIKRFIKTDGGYFEMTDLSEVPLSRRKKDDVFKSLEKKDD